jgi:clan AA aspartic protease
MPDRSDPMMRGVVNARHEAVVRLRVRGPGGVESDVDTIVDSGFTSSLTLPTTTLTALGLARQSGGIAKLADGSVCPFDIFAAEVEWDGAWRPVLISAVGNEPLLGMRLLAGHKLVIEVVPGGLVEILPLP